MYLVCFKNIEQINMKTIMWVWKLCSGAEVMADGVRVCTALIEDVN